MFHVTLGCRMWCVFRYRGLSWLSRHTCLSASGAPATWCSEDKLEDTVLEGAHFHSRGKFWALCLKRMRKEVCPSAIGAKLSIHYQYITKFSFRHSIMGIYNSSHHVMDYLYCNLVVSGAIRGLFDILKEQHTFWKQIPLDYLCLWTTTSIPKTWCNSSTSPWKIRSIPPFASTVRAENRMSGNCCQVH